MAEVKEQTTYQEPEVVIDVQNLSVGFHVRSKKTHVIRNISFKVYRGETLAIVGESGSGKSVTTKTFTGMLESNGFISGGSIKFHDWDLTQFKTTEDWQKIRGKRIATIFQDPMTSLNPLYTIGNQLIESIKAHSKVTTRQAMRKAREVMDLVQIPEAEKKMQFYPHEFSGGMKQRIIIAMALAGNAELIIADEPTTALDVTIQKQIMDLILDIKNEFGTTVILISHDLALVSNYSDTITVMYSGHIVEQASAKEFFKNPRHPYSIALLNSLPTTSPSLKLKTITGAPPSIEEKISGCKFHPRCDFCEIGLCDVQNPVLEEKTSSHFSACLRF